MSRPSTPSKRAAGASASTARSHREDVLQFLDNLDSFEGDPKGDSGSAQAGSPTKASSSSGPARPGSSSATVGQAATGEDAQSVLDFLDEIVTSRDRKPASSLAGSSNAGAAGKRPTSSSSAAAANASGISRSSSRTTLRDGTTSNNRKSTESVRGSSYLTPSTPVNPPAAAPSGSGSAAALAAEKLQDAPSPIKAEAPAAASGGWGWGSVWSQASTVIQQARTVAEEQVSKNLNNLPKNLPSYSAIQSQLPNVSSAQASAQASQAASAASEQAQKWRSGMLNILSTHVDIDKLRRDITETGLKAMNDIINAVAPPIAEHEVIQVNLSHDMLGYEGVETLVYRALAKVMEQVDGGDLVVNRGNVEDQPVQSGSDEDDRNLNTVEGFVEAYKLAEANLEALIKKNYKKPEQPTDSSSSDEKTSPTTPTHGRKESNVTVPVTLCPVFMRIQPVLAPLPFSIAGAAPQEGQAATTPGAASDEQYLFFILLLRDPTNELVHRTLSQSMPSKWLDIPFEENEWVEDIMVDVIRRGVEILGEEYVKGRMHGRLLKNAPANETLFDDQQEKSEGPEEGASVEKVAAEQA